MMRTSAVTSRGDMPAVPVRRSLLFVPGNRPERFMKALAASPDVVVIDLEDDPDLGVKFTQFLS